MKRYELTRPYVCFLSMEEVEPELLDVMIPLVSVERREKIAAYKFMKDKLLSACAGVMVRYFLQLIDGRMYSEANIVYSEKGKPSFEVNNFHFSISHTENITAVGIFHRPIGIDAEHIGSYNVKEIACRFFTKEEIEYVFADEEISALRFFGIWTRKEAYVKKIGCGFANNKVSEINVLSFELNENLFTVDYNSFVLSVCTDYLAHSTVVEGINYEQFKLMCHILEGLD